MTSLEADPVYGRRATRSPHVLIPAAVLLALLGCAAPLASPPPEASPTPELTTLPELSPSPNATALNPRPSPALTPASSPAPTPSSPAPTQATAVPSALPRPSSWIGPEQISTRNYGAISLVVDPQGIAHAAAQLNGGISYLTNGSGSWTRERVSGPLGRNEIDGTPSIAIDVDGSLWLAFSRGGCGEIGCIFSQLYIVTNASGAWGEPRLLVDGRDPSLVVRNEHIHIAYRAGVASDALCGPTESIRYVTVVSGELIDVPIASAASGGGPQLQLGSDGRAHILFDDYCRSLGRDGLWYATVDASSATTLEAIAGTNAANDWALGLALGLADTPHALFARFDDEGDSLATYLTVLGRTGWSAPELIVSDAFPMAIATDGEGAVHLLALGESGGWYVTDRSGVFESRPMTQSGTLPREGGALAIDSSGRPHLLYVIREGQRSSPELWYAIGPGS